MNFLTTFYADKGLIKQNNQDSVCIKTARTYHGNVTMAIVCDGMGGFAKGELASATVVKSFANWFDEELPRLLNDGLTPELLRERWNYIIDSNNYKILQYGSNNNLKLGTTIAGLFIMDNEYIVTVSIGDSRVYKINDGVYQLTEDQTIVQYDLNCGKITREQAENDPRKHVLLQCIGSTSNLRPAYLCEDVMPDSMYLICTDGFCSKLNNNELMDYLNPRYNMDENTMQQKLSNLTQTVKSRKETDNITSVLVRTCI
ncbi:MAG: serine/threonine-protein phosphatase [Lachnospiraceae bacterium]|nr:serine/threonine-protein phosphatase [Lachnospiraceae bacterium]